MVDVPDGAQQQIEDMLAIAAKEARLRSEIYWDGTLARKQWGAASEALRSYAVMAEFEVPPVPSEYDV